MTYKADLLHSGTWTFVDMSQSYHGTRRAQCTWKKVQTLCPWVVESTVARTGGHLGILPPARAVLWRQWHCKKLNELFSCSRGNIPMEHGQGLSWESGHRGLGEEEMPIRLRAKWLATRQESLREPEKQHIFLKDWRVPTDWEACFTAGNMSYKKAFMN